MRRHQNFSLCFSRTICSTSTTIGEYESDRKYEYIENTNIEEYYIEEYEYNKEYES